jgi:hypothetical protein
MPAGLGGSGYVALTFETTMGTYLDPSTAGTVFIPILSESLEYNEDKYYSPQIRQSTIASEVKQSYYHVEGDLELEVDTAFLPYLLYLGRYTITKTGASAPFNYKFVPSSAGSASTAASGAVPRTASITVVRNGIGFGYAGCCLAGGEFTIDSGVLKFTANIMGLSENDPAGLGTPTWTTAKLLGANAHSIYVAASAASPTFGAASTDFNGFTFTQGFNASPQNRIVSSRAASYISYGETEVTYSTELDFINKTEYNNMKNAASRAIKLESIGDGVAFGVSADAVKIQANRSVYNTYPVALGGMGDLIMASIEGRAIGIAGGNAYEIQVQSNAAIT